MSTHQIGYPVHSILTQAIEAREDTAYKFFDLLDIIPDPFYIYRETAAHLKTIIRLRECVSLSTSNDKLTSPVLKKTTRMFREMLQATMWSLCKLCAAEGRTTDEEIREIETLLEGAPLDARIERIYFTIRLFCSISELHLQCIAYNSYLARQRRTHSIAINRRWSSIFSARVMGNSFPLKKQPLGSGGVATVFSLKKSSRFVVKKFTGLRQSITESACGEATLSVFFHKPRDCIKAAQYLLLDSESNPVLLIPKAKGTLEQVMSRSPNALFDEEGKANPSALIRFLKTTARALYVMHRVGVTHGDIKEDNITDKGELIDLSIARFFGHSYISTAAAYRAPEVCFAAWRYQRNPASDIWALGAVILSISSHKAIMHYLFKRAKDEGHSFTSNRFSEQSAHELGEIIFSSEESQRRFQRMIDRLCFAYKPAKRGHPLNDILSSMLRIDPTERPSALQLLTRLRALN